MDILSTYGVNIVCLIIFIIIVCVLLFRNSEYRFSFTYPFRKLKTLLRNSIKKIDIFDIFGMREIDRLIDNLKERDEIIKSEDRRWNALFEFEDSSRKNIITSHKQKIKQMVEEIQELSDSYIKDRKNWRKASIDNQANIKSYTDEIVLLRNKLEKRIKELDSVIVTVNILKADLARSKSNEKDLKITASELHKDLIGRNETIKTLSDALVNKQNQILEMEKIIENLRIELKILDKEIETYKWTVQSCRAITEECLNGKRVDS